MVMKFFNIVGIEMKKVKSIGKDLKKIKKEKKRMPRKKKESSLLVLDGCPPPPLSKISFEIKEPAWNFNIECERRNAQGELVKESFSATKFPKFLTKLMKNEPKTYVNQTKEKCMLTL